MTGTFDERDTVLAVSRAAESRLIERLSLSIGGLAALLRRARLTVANDTGVSHLSVATGTPTLVVGTTSDLPRWAPIDRHRHAAVQTADDVADDVSAVMAEVDRLLEAVPAGAPVRWRAPR